MSDDTKVQLVVSDLDGTFLADDKSVPPENISAVQLLKERGMQFTFCTGRPVAMIAAYMKQAGVTLPVIGCNGGFIYDAQQKNVLMAHTFEAEIVRTLVAYSFLHELDFLAYTAETVFYSPNSKRVEVFRAYNERARETGCEEASLTVIADATQLVSERITKILITELHGNDLQHMAQFLQHVPTIECVPSTADVLDIMPAGVTKGGAVKQLAEHLGVALQNVCVFGDTTNDISMLECAGVSVCMANGTDDAKRAAAHVTTRTNNNGGFAEGVRQFVLGVER
ncbi:MAG: HAD family hydrolase [Treponema sp.]|nr:HAD family hydrolase [Treponema sp.]